MTTEAEKRAREYTMASGWSIIPDDVAGAEARAIYDAFLAGQQSQWRKYPEERPDKNDCYWCLIYDISESSPEPFPAVMTWHEGYWEDDKKYIITHFMPITLPETKEPKL